LEQKLLEFAKTLNSENTVLVDTPFLIYHLEDIKPYSDITAEILDFAGAENSKIFLSIVSYTEILVGILNQKKPDAEKIFKDLIISNPFIEIVDFRYELAEVAAGIRSETGLGLADSIIAATALKSDVKFLITNDLKFLKIKSSDFKIILLNDLAGLDSKTGRDKKG